MSPRALKRNQKRIDLIVLKATQEKLLSVLQSVAGIVEKRHTLPILANVLVRKTAGNVQFTTSDLEIVGNGPAQTVVDGGSATQPFLVSIGAATLKGPIEAANDRASRTTGARSRSRVPRLPIHTPAPVIAAARVAVGTVNSVVTSATCHGNRGAFQFRPRYSKL